MARLFPKIDPSEIKNDGERKVAEALVGQIESDVEVFHSFNWLEANRFGTLTEGECDFVVIDPRNGLLFVEVKGGTLEFDPTTMEWSRILVGGRRKEVKKDPFDQARASMHKITKLIESSFPGQQLPFTYGYAVAFPDSTYTGSLPASTHPDLVLDANGCADIRSAIQRIFDRFRRYPPPPVLDARQISAIHEALYPKFAIVPVIWRKVEDQEERLRRLTEEQKRLLDFLGDHNLAAIRGVAGSGKTILALAKAQEMARRGMRTLLLCYNRPLKDWLLEAIPYGFSDNLVIDTYHGLVSDFCKVAKVEFNPSTREGDFWKDVAPELLINCCEILGSEEKFDAIIVDEGQDFEELWWTSLEDLFRNPREKGCYYVFFDPNQNLFVSSPTFPGELGSPFELPMNCRNTVRIAEHCSSLIDKTCSVRSGAPIGDEPEIVRVKSVREAFEETGKRVRKLCMPNAGGLKNYQVAVLAPSSTEAEWPKDFGTVKATKSFDQWRQNKGVLIASWTRFKGLEADVVIIIETPSDDSTNEAAHKYVARSRAKHYLTILEVCAQK